jgi:hypothetical protein
MKLSRRKGSIMINLSSSSRNQFFIIIAPERKSIAMPTNYFQTTQDLLDPSPYILKHSKPAKAVLADNLFRKKLYETPKKDIPALIDYHYQRCDEPTEFADHVIELLEVALDENADIKFLKSLSFWGDPEKAKAI